MNVYMITNIVTNKKYIGVTKGTIKRRISTHFQNARNGRKELLYNSIRKHGQQNFKVEHIASSFDVDSLYELEKILIKQYDTQAPHGYNMNEGGEGSKGLKLTPEQKLAHSERMKERYKNMSPEERQQLSKRISESKKGMTPLPHMYENKNKGIIRSQEFKNKVSKGMSEYANSNREEMARRAKKKPISSLPSEQEL